MADIKRSSEIKFRAWSSIAENMFNNQVSLDILAQQELFRIAGKEDLWPDFTFMQYTGLKDKNGKEIYEGDIIELGETNFTKEVIIFDKGSFGIKASWLKDNKYGDPFVELNKYCNPVFEGCVLIVGNIYENPELLEGE
jgi:uncharacterized phage protein (TIGR01671 family)